MSAVRRAAVDVISPYDPYPKQQIFHSCPAHHKLFGGAVGGGKLQPLDSLVYTPFGPKCMGDVKVGDQVSNPDGTVARVIAVHPHAGMDIYRVTFDDGASCEVGLEHLWQVSEASVRRFRKKKASDDLPRWRVATTEQLIKDLRRGKRLLIPLSAPVQFTVTSRNASARWPIAPYVLGAFLGDGSIGGGALTLTSVDAEVTDRVAAEGWQYTSVVTNGDRAPQYVYPPAYKTHFKQLGLVGHRSWEKFIPEQYKLCPLEMRWALMQGLMDTDGYADSRGHASYCTVSERLALDVQWLARSLGFKANITSKVPTYTLHGEKLNGRRAYNVWIKGDAQGQLFGMARKRERAEQLFNGGVSKRTRRIESIELVRHAAAQCITVNNPNGLYLTDDFIVTHNSDALIAELHETVMEVEALGYSDQVLMLRRTYPELQENIDRARELIGDLAVWRASEKRFLYPNGSTLEFGHVQHDEDVLAYKSRQFLVIAFDEETSFSEHIRMYMQTRNRSKTPHVQPKMIGATNPGDVGHLAVASYYIDVDPQTVGERLFYWPIMESEKAWAEACNAEPMELGEAKAPTLDAYRELLEERGISWRSYPPGTAGKPEPFDVWRPKASAAMVEVNEQRREKGLPEIKPPTRAFIPSFLHDNPSLSMDGQYEALLLSNPNQKVALTLYYGDWSSWDGQAFPEFRKTKLVDTSEGMVEKPWHVIGPVLPAPHWRKWRAIDWGYGAPLCCLWGAEDPETGQLMVYRELYRAELRDREAVDLILAMTPFDETIALTAVDPKSFWQGNSNDDGRKLYEIYKDYGLEVVKAQNARIDGKRRIHDLLAENLEHRQPGLVVTEDCPNLIRTIASLVAHPERMEDVDDRGDDHCFVAGTLIATERGELPIEDVRPGDRVLTRAGYKNVMLAWQTNANAPTLTVELSNGTSLRGTPNHPVWVDGQGWTRLDALRYGDILMAWNPEQKQSFLTARSTAATRIASMLRTACTSMLESLTGSAARRRSIVTCGLRPMVRSLMVITFITATVIASITNSIITSAFPLTTILSGTGSRPSGLRGCVSMLTRFARRLPNGTSRTRAVPGIASMRVRCSAIWSRLSIAASSAVRRFSRRSATGCGSAPTPVSRAGDVPRSSITSSVPAVSVGPSSALTATSPPATAPVRVLRSRASANAPVYNLHVSGQHEYFANGVLVHNCYDALRYLCMAKPGRISRSRGLRVIRPSADNSSMFPEALTNAVRRPGSRLMIVRD